ncbi:MAG TPA: dTMP kinase [Stellaceae bacterium]|nr:dTMP kinase [Stellaceae bacterium]
MARGRFITVEGGEGVGKSTQVSLLAAALERNGLPVQQTREPGGSRGAESIRKLLLEGSGDRWDAVSEALLVTAARRDHVSRLIAPALERGIWVVCDRFTDSTYAYQGYGRGMPLADIAALQRVAIGELVPDLTLILDLPVGAGLARAAARPGAGDRFEGRERAFHERLRDGFRRIASDDPKRCVLIKASGSPETVHAAVLAAVSRHFALVLR